MKEELTVTDSWENKSEHSSPNKKNKDYLFSIVSQNDLKLMKDQIHSSLYRPSIVSKVADNATTYCNSSGIKSKMIDSLGSSNAPGLGGTLKAARVAAPSNYGSIRKTREELVRGGELNSMQNELFGNAVISEEEA